MVLLKAAIVVGYPFCTFRRLVAGVVAISRIDKSHIHSHFAGIVRGNQHLRLFLRFRQRFTTEYRGIAVFGKRHQFGDKILLIGCGRYFAQYLLLFRTVNTDIGGGSVIRYLIVERRKFRHLDEIAETLLLNDVVCHGKFKVGGFLGENSRPCVKTPNILHFKRIGTQVFEQQIQLRQRIGDCCTRKECGTEVFAGTLLNGSDCEQQVKRTVAALGVAQSRNAVMTGIEREIFETVAFINQNMVDAHAFEIHHVVTLPFKTVAHCFQP